MWTYFSKTGELADAEGQVVASGYSGHGAGRNNPAMQGVVNVGPIPAGTYAIGSARDTEAHGPVVMPLVMVSGESFGRGGFLMHGDNWAHDASEGCIILDRPARLRVAESADRVLKVVG